MFKRKIMMTVLGLALILIGFGNADNTMASKITSINPMMVSFQSNQHTSDRNFSKIESSTSTNKSVKSDKTITSSTSSPVTRALNMRTITAVRLADFKTGWVGGNGWVAKTTSQGKKWTVVYKGSGTVQQIFALNHANVWAVMNQAGNTSNLLQSKDGGKQWNIIGKMPNHAFLHFISKKIALTGNSLSKDGGKTWKSLPVPKNIVGAPYFHDTKNGWAVTKTNKAFYVKRTTNGGSKWKTVMSKNIASTLNDAIIRSASTNDAWVELIGDSGMAQTSYSLFHTTNGGASWKTVIANSTAGGGPAPGVTGNKGPKNKGTQPGPLYVVNTQTAFMVGKCPACDKQNSIGWTKNGGKTWVNSKAALEGSGESYIAFSDPDHGWWITTDYEKPSTMYTTSNGGAGWKRVHIFQ